MSCEKRGPGWHIRSCHVILLGLLWLMGPAALSPAAEPVPAATQEGPPTSAIPAPPDFMRNKPPIP
ncbi:MAG: hypothetical protein ACHQ7N_13900, partial [Candidatus Methylomirabilales bacterium]